MENHKKTVQKFLASNFAPDYKLCKHTIKLFKSKKQFSKNAEHISNCGVESGDHLLICRNQAIEHTNKFFDSIKLYYQYIAIHQGLAVSQFLHKHYEFNSFTVEEISYFLTGRHGYRPEKSLDFRHTLGYFFIKDICKNYRDYRKSCFRA